MPVGKPGAGRRTDRRPHDAGARRELARSGARDRAEYVEWANHVCGMACLKMVLSHRDGEAPPLLELARRSLPYGAYVREGSG